MYVVVFQGSPLGALLSKADAEQQRTVRQDSLGFTMSFLTNLTVVLCPLGVAVAILEPGGSGRCAERVKLVAVKQM